MRIAIEEPAEDRRPASRYVIFAIASVALLMGSVDSTIVATDLHASLAWTSWTITAYLLGQTVAIPIASLRGMFRQVAASSPSPSPPCSSTARRIRRRSWRRLRRHARDRVPERHHFPKSSCAELSVAWSLTDVPVIANDHGAGMDVSMEAAAQPGEGRPVGVRPWPVPQVGKLGRRLADGIAAALGHPPCRPLLGRETRVATRARVGATGGAGRRSRSAGTGTRSRVGPPAPLPLALRPPRPAHGSVAALADEEAAGGVLLDATLREQAAAEHALRGGMVAIQAESAAGTVSPFPDLVLEAVGGGDMAQCPLESEDSRPRCLWRGP